MSKKIQESAREWLAGQTMFEDSPMVEASRLVAALADQIDTLEAAVCDISAILLCLGRAVRYEEGRSRAGWDGA